MKKWKMGCLSCCGKIKIIKVKFFKVRYICKICGYNKFYLKKNSLLIDMYIGVVFLVFVFDVF